MLQQGQLVTAVQAAHQLQRAVQGLGVACGLSLQLGGCPAKQAGPSCRSLSMAFWALAFMVWAFSRM